MAETSKEPFYVVCALTGGWPQERPDLGSQYVRKLSGMARRFLPRHTFVCYSDKDVGVLGIDNRPARLKGWWAKLHAYSHDFPVGARVLVLDLDTVLLRNARAMAQAPLDLPVFIRGDMWFDSHAGSGVFSFRVSEQTYQLWDALSEKNQLFADPPFVHPNGTSCLTDEHWIHQWIMPDKWRGWCDVLPGQVVSWRYGLHQSMEQPPEPICCVYFDGHPRPHDVVAEWNPHWRGVHEW